MKYVRKNIFKARLGRTTIVVAHRLTTIRNADVIFALDGGKVMESGTHAQLMEKRGVYYNLVITQEAGSKKDSNNNPEDDEDDDERENKKRNEIADQKIFCNQIS